MTRQQARNIADRIVTLNDVADIPAHFRNMLAFHVRANIIARGWYAYREIADNGSDLKVFVELTCAS
jgi:hypothetical protein